jgi:release factor glutamine methyltransferase
MMTISDLVRGARDRFVSAGISANLATLDAEVLARQVLGWDRARFLADRENKATSVFLLQYEPLVARRERREPVSYILGTREFWGLEFEVGPDVLIPRPETELVIEETLALTGTGSSPVVMDVGTGSGCIAIVLAREIPGARVIATDVSRYALEVARRNAARHGVADRIRFVETSYLDGIVEMADVIVSNPPYVPVVSEPGLTPEVRDYEPPVAVFAGEDGLDAVRAIVSAAAERLAPEGWLVMEFGCGQDSGVTSLVEGAAGIDVVKIRHDLQDIPRTMVCRRCQVHDAIREGR